MATTKITKANQSEPRVKTPPLSEQPQSKAAAAAKVGMTLSTNDQWSRAYWNRRDLHCEERELFG